ncbi:MAG: PP0621 family protein [Pseudomonadota bacterium]|nr:PP0621 family protein [Pseudomonadota bacterium]
MSGKLLVLLLAVLAGVWLWRRGQRARQARRTGRRMGALPMTRCAHCGMHVPVNEAVPGQRGSYCSAAHRRDSEGGA